MKGFEWKGRECVVDTTNKKSHWRVRRRRLVWLKDMARQPLQQQFEWIWMRWDCISWGEKWEKIKSSIWVTMGSICQLHIWDGISERQAAILVWAEEAGLGAWVETWHLNCLLQGELSRNIKCKRKPFNNWLHLIISMHKSMWRLHV